MPASMLRSFIESCFHLDPAQRPDAHALLLHPFLSDAVDRPNAVVNIDGTAPLTLDSPSHRCDDLHGASASISDSAASVEWPTWARAQKQAVLADHTTAVPGSANPFARDSEPSWCSALNVLRAESSSELMEKRAAQVRNARALSFVVSCTGPDVFHPDKGD